MKDCESNVRSKLGITDFDRAVDIQGGVTIYGFRALTIVAIYVGIRHAFFVQVSQLLLKL